MVVIKLSAENVVSGQPSKKENGKKRLNIAGRTGRVFQQKPIMPDSLDGTGRKQIHVRNKRQKRNNLRGFIYCKLRQELHKHIFVCAAVFFLHLPRLAVSNLCRATATFSFFTTFRDCENSGIL